MNNRTIVNKLFKKILTSLFKEIEEIVKILMFFFFSFLYKPFKIGLLASASFIKCVLFVAQN